MPGYERWAQQQRAWVEQKIASRSADEAEVLNSAAKASLESVHRRFDKVDEMDSRMSKVESAQAQMLTIMARTDHNMSCNGGGGGGGVAAAGPAAARYAEGKQFGFCCHLFSFSLANFSFSSAPVAAVQTVNDELMASGRLPAMTSSLPKLFPLLLKEWRSKALHSFRHFKFPPSENALKQACSKRVHLSDAIVASKTDAQSLEEAAHVLKA
jgi:hypothetical protein